MAALRGPRLLERIGLVMGAGYSVLRFVLRTLMVRRSEVCSGGNFGRVLDPAVISRRGRVLPTSLGADKRGADFLREAARRSVGYEALKGLGAVLTGVSRSRWVATSSSPISSKWLTSARTLLSSELREWKEEDLDDFEPVRPGGESARFNEAR